VNSVSDGDSMLENPQLQPGAFARLGLRACLCFVTLCFLGLQGAPARAETVALDRIEHIHGLSVDPEHPGQLYLATHSGLFLARPDGSATRVGTAQDDLMSFAPDPGDPNTFYASGHPPGGGNLGFLTSRDRGVTWQRVAEGADGPVDFHAMAVSRADPKVIYGLYKGLQVSRDGGQSWSVAGTLPKDTFDLAVSARDPRRLYAGARAGLFLSEDGGINWAAATMWPRPTPLVQVAADGRVYAFVYGVGLIAGDDVGGTWELRSEHFADRYLVHMASDPADPQVLHVVADTGAIVTSKDGGRTWVSYLGHDRENPELVAKAGRLYGKLCQSCHGHKGIGERPEDIHGTDEYGFVAPPLDDSSHGWHHADRDLAQTILKGSPRNPRMMPFQELITPSEAGSLVAYIKSLWSFRSLACQGARHMRCMH
jgi:mono/diheme cytochrome c family protein